MINLSMPAVETELKPRITVFGVGGAGGNAVNNMIKSNLEGVEFVIGNTDAQALNGSLAQRRVQLGTTITRGLGAGSRPDVGRAAAEEQIDEIIGHLDGTNMVFITAGMGGGTGTGAAPVIARVARERGILTVGVVTKPFHFEGAHRMRLAESGIAELQQYVDTLIIIPNQNLFRIANEKTTFADAFKMADDVLHSGVRGVTDLMVMPGLINLDFADIRSVMTEMGKAMMGTGEAGGERRSIQAAEAAISNPLLDDVSMKGARGVLINITGGYDMTLFEVDEAANRIRDEVDPDANIIFGSTFDPAMEGIMRVSVVATGIDAAAMAQARNAAQAQAQAHAQAHAQAAAQPVRKPAAPVAPVAAPSPAAPSRPDYHSTLVAAPVHPATQQPHSAPVRAVEAEAPLAAEETHATDPGAVPHMVHQHPAHHVAQPVHAVHSAQPAPHPQPAQPVRPEPAGISRMSGPLRGERREGVFIAPRPVEAGPRHHAPVHEPAPAPRQAPPQQAEIIDDRPRKRGLSLFERMTGWGRAASNELEAAPRQAQAQSPVAPVQRAMPQQQPQQPAAKAPPVRLAHDSGNRPPRSEEEMLDIPAFLRRQAN